MARPAKSNCLSEKQIAEIVELSATKKTIEITRIYKKHRATIHYHLKKNGIINWKKRARFKREKEIEPIIKKSLSPIIKSTAQKNYKDYLKIENEKRNKNGWRQFKKPSPWISIKGL